MSLILDKKIDVDHYSFRSKFIHLRTNDFNQRLLNVFKICDEIILHQQALKYYFVTKGVRQIIINFIARKLFNRTSGIKLFTF